MLPRDVPCRRGQDPSHSRHRHGFGTKHPKHPRRRHNGGGSCGFGSCLEMQLIPMSGYACRMASRRPVDFGSCRTFSLSATRIQILMYPYVGIVWDDGDVQARLAKYMRCAALLRVPVGNLRIRDAEKACSRRSPTAKLRPTRIHKYFLNFLSLVFFPSSADLATHCCVHVRI